MQIVVMDKLDYCATRNNVKTLQGLKNFKFVKGDIQSMDLVSHVLERENVDTIMHFAAQVRFAYQVSFVQDAKFADAAAICCVYELCVAKTVLACVQHKQ